MEDSHVVFTVREKRVIEQVKRGSARNLRISSYCIILFLIILLSYFGLKANEAIEQVGVLKSHDLAPLVNFLPETKNEIFFKQALLKCKQDSLILIQHYAINTLSWSIYSAQLFLVLLILINASLIPNEGIINKLLR